MPFALIGAVSSARGLERGSLADSGGVSERIFYALPDMVRNFYTVSARPGDERNLMVPDFAADCCDRVAEGQDLFCIPCGGFGLELSSARRAGGRANSPISFGIGAEPGHQEHRRPSIRLPIDASGWRSMVLLVPQPGQNTSSEGVPASIAEPSESEAA